METRKDARCLLTCATPPLTLLPFRQFFREYDRLLTKHMSKHEGIGHDLTLVRARGRVCTQAAVPPPAQRRAQGEACACCAPWRTRCPALTSTTLAPRCASILAPILPACCCRLPLQDMAPPSDNYVCVRVLQDAGMQLFSFGPLGLHEGTLVGGAGGGERGVGGVVLAAARGGGGGSLDLPTEA